MFNEADTMEKLEELAASTAGAVLAEIQRIEAASAPRWEDAEDLITYAKEIVTLRNEVAALRARSAEEK